jgi:hypothetical protein
MTYAELIETFAGHVDWRRVNGELIAAWNLKTYIGLGLKGVRPQMLRHHGRPAEFVHGMLAWEMAKYYHVVIRYLGDEDYTMLTVEQWLAGNPEEMPYADE